MADQDQDRAPPGDQGCSGVLPQTQWAGRPLEPGGEARGGADQCSSGGPKNGTETNCLEQVHVHVYIGATKFSTTAAPVPVDLLKF